MRGRTNVGGAGGAEIYADTELFTVAEGSNVTAGNFVQYKLVSNDRKYDTNEGFNYEFYKSGNEAPKVLPCGNNKYIRRYKNTKEENIIHFELIDVKNKFDVISSISFMNEYIPSFCLLNDGNIAICYMTNINSFTIKIYDISSSFLLLNSYEFTEDNIGEIGTTHITQLGDSRIIVNKFNDCLVCNYDNGAIIENKYVNLGISLSYGGATCENMINGDNDWNIYGMEEDKILIFPLFHAKKTANNDIEYVYCAYLLKISYDSPIVLDEKIIKESKYYATYNCAIWGNAFGVDGKILLSDGTTSDGKSSIYSTNATYYYETKIYYCENDLIMQSGGLNIYEESAKSFDDLEQNIPGTSSLGIYPALFSSGTAQFTKNNVFYAAVRPDLWQRYIENGATNSKLKEVDSKSRTAIYRVEYNSVSRTFSISNIVTFEADGNGYRFGFGQFFENDSGDVYYLYETSASTSAKRSGRWIMKLSYKNGVLSIGDSTGMVENYNASGAAIGVAKQSGSAGQEVEVYVPKV